MWKTKVQKVYDSLEELKAYNNLYGIVKSCGYESAEKLWEDNPLLQGSTDPKDFGLAKVNHKRTVQKGLKEISSKYWEGIPMLEISDLLKANGAMLIQEDGTEWSGILCGSASVVDIKVKGIKTNGLSLGWYKMQSGRYEINAYLM